MKLPKPTSKDQKGYNRVVPAVDQAGRILLTLARHESGSMLLTEICKKVGIHNSKGYSILNTLESFGFVQRNPESKAYSLGIGLIFLSQRVLDSLDVRQSAAPFLRRLSSHTASTAFLGWISDNKFYVVAKDHGSQIVAVTFRLGQRFPLYWGAHGKAILSVLPDEERERIISSGAFSFKNRGKPYDLAHLEQHLEFCRKNGYAIDVGEQKEGINVVAAPIFGPTAKLLGAFVVIGTFPNDLLEEYGQQVAAEARKFSQSMTYFTFGTQ